MHRLTGQRYAFVTPYREHLARTMREQIQLISEAQTVPEVAFEAYRSVGANLNQDEFGSSKDGARRVSGEIKASISVLEFVGRYVDLTPAGNGATGLRPFHDDRRPSFGVNVEENYWHCFAGCGGGSVIDFWMKWKQCDFTAAVTELAEMLL